MPRWMKHRTARWMTTEGLGASSISYLINDTFTTSLAAGAVNGTAAEPGPGTRTVVDTNSKLSIAADALSIATGGSGSGNPGLYYDLVTRAAGRMLIAQAVSTNETFAIGFDPNQLTAINHAVRWAGSSRTWQVYVNGLGLSVGNWTIGATYNIAVVMRATGAYFFAKIGGNWQLLYPSGAGSQDCYPAIAVESATGVLTVDYIRVPSARWLPPPLVSDGFSVWGSSDGLGHAEGVAGGLGSGGNGMAWTSAVGTWGASGGVAAASALSAGRAIATVDCGKADLVISANMVVPTATLAIVVRWTDESNFIMLRRTPTNLQLVKVVAGATTTVSDNASTYVAGAEVRLVCDGTKFRMFYNNAAVSTEQTISDAAVQSATVVGLRSGDVACTADNFVAYARGSGGEYSILDSY